jgi:hypothetical protein
MKAMIQEYVRPRDLIDDFPAIVSDVPKRVQLGLLPRRRSI